MWFDFGELPRAAGLRFEDRPGSADHARMKMTEFRCPACVVPLREREIGSGSGIRIEQCPDCSGILLDKGELARVHEHFKAAGAAPIEPGPHVDDNTIYVDPDSGAFSFVHYLVGLPVELDIPQTMFPPVVLSLILLNVLTLVVAMVNGLEASVDALGLVPADIKAGRHLYTLLTHMFMHGGILHLIGNMYFLYISGDNVEERFGWGHFLLFYIFCGLSAALAHVWLGGVPFVPAVGASGAVSGVLGAYVVLFPQNRFMVRGISRWGLRGHPYEIILPCWAYLGFWVVVQAFFATMDIPGVAWWAHLGGFGCGAAIAVMVRTAAGRWVDRRGEVRR
jgi:membrane associated rhomboid family serine protease/Zn-finger nucleic acid-binding protein